MKSVNVKLWWRGEAVERNLYEALLAGAEAAAKVFARDLKTSLLRTQGNKALRYHSAPGEIPFYITGNYAASIRIRTYKGNLKGTVKITSFSEHEKMKGTVLEEGRKTGKPLLPRPHWRPIFDANRSKMQQIVKAVARTYLGSNAGDLDVDVNLK